LLLEAVEVEPQIIVQAQAAAVAREVFVPEQR
jgi:hypothetical protein